MKTFLTISALSLLSTVALAQTKLDHGYSTHNYKHPNKAATARQLEQKPSVTVTEAPTVASYKAQQPGQQTTGGVQVAVEPNTNVASHNYKAQHQHIKQMDMSRYAKRQPKTTREAGTATGNGQ